MKVFLIILALMFATQTAAELKKQCGYYFENGQCLKKKNHTKFYANVIKDVKFSSVRIKQVETDFHGFAKSFCPSGNIFYEIYGDINDDTVFAFKTLFQARKHCGYTEVLLFSGGGYLEDGFELGRFFRKNSISTYVIPDADCASSCAVAFLGGTQRVLAGNGNLMFHSPYYKRTHGIECVKKSPDLLNYYRDMIGSSMGTALYEKTLRECSNRDGWTINRDAAQMYDIVK